MAEESRIEYNDNDLRDYPRPLLTSHLVRSTQCGKEGYGMNEKKTKKCKYRVSLVINRYMIRTGGPPDVRLGGGIVSLSTPFRGASSI